MVAVALSPAGASGGVNDRLNGAAPVHVKSAPVIAPLTEVPAEPLTTVPVPSSRAQRATSPEVDAVISPLALDLICASVRAESQIRTSSRTPSKNPFVPPDEVSAVARAAR